MKRPPFKVVLPIFVAVLVIIVLVVTGHIPPSPPSNGSPLKIIVYTDFECGACGRFNSEIEPELRSRYEATGKAQIEIRLLGATSSESMRAAEAALCAGDQGRFWEYQDDLFNAWREQEEDYAVFSVEALAQLAAALGLDEAAFSTCLNSQVKKAEVEKNMDMAHTDGVGTLPALLVGNFTIQGYKPLDTYVQAIEETLARQSAQ
jgi:protein-disulfide isomerase